MFSLITKNSLVVKRLKNTFSLLCRKIGLFHPRQRYCMYKINKWTYTVIQYLCRAGAGNRPPILLHTRVPSKENVFFKRFTTKLFLVIKENL